MPAETLSKWLSAHRLDFETSGCLLVCAPEHHEAYLALFKDSSSTSTQKIYLVGASKDMHLPRDGLLVEGWIASRYRGSKSVRFLEDDAPEVRKKWHSKRAIKHRVWKADDEAVAAAKKIGFKGFPYVVQLHSGARHQLRAAFKAWDAPLLNDPVYGAADPEAASETNSGAPLELHAWKLSLTDPLSGVAISATASERF
jgi:23S rRNA-/tRNA-specific pseudouridylate synthase